MCDQSPNFREIAIEDLGNKYKSLITRTFEEPTDNDVIRCRPLIEDILKKKADYTIKENLSKVLRTHHFNHKHSFLYKVFCMCKETQGYSDDDESYLRQVLKIKGGRSHSGIISVTVFTSPYPEYYDPISGEYKKQSFSCKWNCAYCPNEPGQPRSYLTGEPGVLRANRLAFDCVAQMHDRMTALFNIGHVIDKLEVLVLGGTWCSYPVHYREEFIRDIYFASNTFMSSTASIHCKRQPMSLLEEKKLNKNATCKVIGLTLETRPDTINARELRLFRSYGCTRIQLGIQHIDDDVLKAIRRQCSDATNTKAIKLLKDCGFKVDAHFMPNLPGSSIEKDTNMFVNNLLGIKKYEKFVQPTTTYEHYEMVNPAMQADQWKVYPCTLVPYTDIEQWFREGKYKPYGQDALLQLLLHMKSKMFPFIRLNRIIRDIPDDYSFLSDYRSNMRQSLQVLMKKRGLVCNCIRCREVKSREVDFDDMKLIVRDYDASDGKEIFLSFESGDNSILFGFLRLRFPSKSNCGDESAVFPELEGCALIRELHTYGKLEPVDSGKDGHHVQHKGIGKRLLANAEDIARKGGYAKISVISGEGVRGYYEKRGFLDCEGVGEFMVKVL